MHVGMNKTLWSTIIGKWVPLDREEACLHKFKTKRNIISIVSLRRSNAKGKMPKFMQHRYEVSMFINHAMTHTHCYGTIELQKPSMHSLPKVLTKNFQQFDVKVICLLLPNWWDGKVNGECLDAWLWKYVVYN